MVVQARNDDDDDDDDDEMMLACVSHCDALSEV